MISGLWHRRSLWSLLFGCFIFIPSIVLAASPSEVIPNDTFWSKQWYLRQIHAPEAWSVTTGTREVVVAVIDAGVDIGHVDLKDNIWTNTKEIPGDGVDNDHDGFVDDVHGWNFVSHSSDVRPVWKEAQMEDAWSHGTIVASLIGARGNDGIGIAGVAWNVRLMPLVVLDADGEGKLSSILEAVRYAVSHGANVINLSLVGYDYDQELDRLIQNASAAGVVVVAATGNDSLQKMGIDIDQTPAYPACFDGTRNSVLGVSGTDTLDQKAPYANYGKTCTDISAPAQELFAARPSFPHGDKPTSSIPGYIDGVTGTSLAAPLVSGVAALIKSVRPEWSADQIRARIVATADPIEDNLTQAEKGGLGLGRLNAGRALDGLMPVRPERVQMAVTEPVTSTGAVPPGLGPWKDLVLDHARLTVSARSSWIRWEDTDTGNQKTWQPYGATYKGGVQAVTFGDEGRWLMWPTAGGGQAMTITLDGRVEASFFPFGTKRLGVWRLEKKADETIVHGPRNFTGRLKFVGNKLQSV